MAGCGTHPLSYNSTGQAPAHTTTHIHHGPSSSNPTPGPVVPFVFRPAYSVPSRPCHYHATTCASRGQARSTTPTASSTAEASLHRWVPIMSSGVGVPVPLRQPEGRHRYATVSSVHNGCLTLTWIETRRILDTFWHPAPGQFRLLRPPDRFWHCALTTKTAMVCRTEHHPIHSLLAPNYMGVEKRCDPCDTETRRAHSGT